MRDARSGGGPRRPFHAAALNAPRHQRGAALKHADRQHQVQQIVNHYAENPRANAKKLRSLGMTADFIRAIHKSSVPKKGTGPVIDVGKALQSGSLFHNFTGVELLDKTANDLTTAAVYSPAGFYQAGKAVGGDVVSTVKGKPTLRGTKNLGKQVGKGFAQDFEHPLRHPGFTGLDALAAISAGTSGAARGVAAAGELGAGAGLGAGLKALVTKPRPGRIAYRHGDLSVEVPASGNTAKRLVQKAYAKHVNAHPDKAARKVGAALERQTHLEAEAARAPAQLLDAYGRKVRKGGMQTALRVVAEGKPIEDRIKFHREQGAKATSKIERRDHAKQIRLLREARKYVEDFGGKPVIRSDAPTLGKVYGHLKDVGAQREAILRDTDQMSAQGLEERKHAPGRVIEGAKYEKPTPAKLGIESPALKRLRRRVVSLEGRIERVTDDVVEHRFEGGRTRVLTGPEKARRLSTLRGALAVAKDELRIQDSRAAKRVKPTGIVGAESFKGGETYVPYFKSEPRGGTGGVASTGTVVGTVRKVVSRNKHYTGQAQRLGQIPGNTTGLVARQTLRSVRYLQSDRFRKQVLKAGSDERKSEHDVLVSEAVTKGGTPKQLSPEAKAVVGKENYTLDELSGHHTAYEDFRRKLFPMQHKGDYTALTPEERLAARDGGKVPGYKWVDERLLRGINKPARSVSTKTGAAAVNLVDTINNASKLAILYLKPAYAVPNIAGNAFLNLVQQGFAAPKNLKAASYLSHKIGDKAAATLDSLMGEGVAQSIGSDAGLGQKVVSAAAGKWSKVVDLPFRRASFIHEARKLGYRTPEKLRALLEDPKHGADLIETAQRANDAIIDYGRLGDFEKQVVRRVIFFYPWVKGSTRYAGHFITEHPVQAATTAQLGEIGKEKSGLGPVPSYLEGSFKVGGKLVNPASAGIFGTSAQVLNTLRGVAEGHPKEAAQLSQFLTPAAALALANITRQSDLGIPFKPQDNALDIGKKTVFDSLPQVALYNRIQALRKHQDQSGKLFPVKGVGDIAGPFGIGGIAPRSYNPTKLHAEALREQQALEPKDQATRYKTFHGELKQAMQRHGEKQIPQSVRGRLALRVERARAREQAHVKDSLGAFKSDVGILQRHKWMTPAEAAGAIKWASTRPATEVGKNELSSALGYLTRHYFDQDAFLSRSVKYLRENGNPNLKLPALP